MLLESRGIDTPQADLITRARAGGHPQLETKRITGDTMRVVMQEFDPEGGWAGGPVGDELLRAHTWRQLLEIFGRRGPWLAQVGRHFVIVDRFDGQTDHFYIRDPWYEASRARGIVAGTHYRVAATTFFEHWIAVAVYRD